MPIFEWTAADLGATVSPGPDDEYARLYRQDGDMLVRVSHEASLRQGTFAGFGRADDPERLQVWGHLYSAYASPATLPQLCRPQCVSAPDPVAAGSLHRGHLTPVSGMLVAVDGAEKPVDGTWELVEVDYSYTGWSDGLPDVAVDLTFRRTGMGFDSLREHTWRVRPPLDAPVRFEPVTEGPR